MPKSKKNAAAKTTQKPWLNFFCRSQSTGLLQNRLAFILQDGAGLDSSNRSTNVPLVPGSEAGRRPSPNRNREAQAHPSSEAARLSHTKRQVNVASQRVFVSWRGAPHPCGRVEAQVARPHAGSERRESPLAPTACKPSSGKMPSVTRLTACRPAAV